MRRRAGVVLRAEQSLKGGMAAGYDRAITAEARACKMLERRLEFRLLVQWRHQIIESECPHAAGLVHAEFVLVRSGFTTALLESEGQSVRQYVTCVTARLLRCPLMPGLLSGVSSDQPLVLFVAWPFLLLRLS